MCCSWKESDVSLCCWLSSLPDDIGNLTALRRPQVVGRRLLIILACKRKRTFSDVKCMECVFYHNNCTLRWARLVLVIIPCSKLYVMIAATHNDALMWCAHPNMFSILFTSLLLLVCPCGSNICPTANGKANFWSTIPPVYTMPNCKRNQRWYPCGACENCLQLFQLGRPCIQWLASTHVLPRTLLRKYFTIFSCMKHGYLE